MKYAVSVDLTGVALAAAQLIDGALPEVRQAVWAVANEAAARWKSAVMHASLWQGEKVSYIKSIQVVEDGPFAVRVFADYKNAGPIETGRPAVDQKRYLQTSLKARVVKHGAHAGQKYLVIPFRHNIAGDASKPNDALAPAMPSAVYAQAKKLAPSRVTGKKMEPNVQGRINSAGHPVMVQRLTYKWGEKLPAGLSPKLKPTHAHDPYEGMVRMEATPGGPGKGPRSSVYLTFRVMGEWSQGWVIPAKPGLFLAKEVSQQIQPLAEGAIQQAMVDAMKGALGQS